jgi:hypothetical protein
MLNHFYVQFEYKKYTPLLVFYFFSVIRFRYFYTITVIQWWLSYTSTVSTDTHSFGGRVYIYTYIIKKITFVDGWVFTDFSNLDTHGKYTVATTAVVASLSCYVFRNYNQ